MAKSLKSKSKPSVKGKQTAGGLQSLLKGRSKLLLILSLFLFAGIGTYVLSKSFAATLGKLYINPSSYVVGANSTFTATVMIQPGTKIDAVDATIKYDPTVMQFVSIDSTNSPFELKLVESGSNGVVKIARGTTKTGGVSTTTWVSKVTFKALKSTSASALQISGNASSAGTYTNPAVAGTTVKIAGAGLAPKAYVSPASKSVKRGSNFSVAVRLNPGVAVDAVEATLTYDKNVMQFVSIDADGTSKFNTALGSNTGGDGVVKLSRGIIGASPVSNDELIANVTFRALQTKVNSPVGLTNVKASGQGGNVLVAPATTGATVSVQ